MSNIAVVGAGFSGAVVARELAAFGHHVDVFEARDHVAGNCYTRRDPATDVMVHVYGPHIFHTANERVWKYINFFGDMVPYNHRVKAIANDTLYSMPINLYTINQFFGTTFTPKAAALYIGTRCKRNGEPRNFEEQALAMIGPELYGAFLRGYTRKQWGRDPIELPASILARLPLRFDYNDSYFSHPYQAIPRHGYTEVVRDILDHKAIAVHLSSPMTADEAERRKFDHTFYSGPLDAWFGHAYGRLAYRTLDFTVETHTDSLGCPVINYCDENIPYTRRTDFKHFTPWEKDHDTSFIYREYSREAKPGDDLFYPVRLATDKITLAQYTERATGEAHTTFIGRLGTYRYLDMDVTIAEALVAADKFIGRKV